MKTMAKTFLLAVVLLLLAACRQAVEPAASVDLAGTNWMLSSLNGKLPLAGTALTLQFGDDGSASGSDGCNRFSTGFTQDGSDLTIDQPMASTMMACEEPIMDQASTYMTALADTSGFSANGNQLSLRNGDETVATFVAASDDLSAADVEPEPATGLAGTSWMLSSLDGNLPLAGTLPTLEFGDDATVSGSDGCNQFNTSFVEDGNRLTFEQPGASTMMACPEAVMDQATTYLEALANTNSFATTESDLVLRSDDLILATFVIVPQDLAGTEWDVLSYNNGRDAVVGVIVGAEISANFGTEDDLSGNAGCNQYFASFSVDDNNIEIGQAGSTMRFCAEPPGVMEQESEYLAALMSAATYTIRGNTLEMRTAEDQIAVMMTRKLPVELPDPEPATPSGRVNAPQGLNIRSGPGVNFPVIGFARNGDEGEIVGRSADNRWWAASVPSAPAGIGWVNADFVIATNAENVPVIEVPPPVVVVPTPAPTPTPAPSPTVTPTPEILFTADRTTIAQGQCATLRWSVANVRAVWVYPLGESFNQFPRTGQGSEQVCPASTTTYEMRVLQLDGATLFRQVTISVAPAGATATPTANPLVGSRWEVANFNDGSALVSPLNETLITIEFSQNGQVTGNGSCNSYLATYQVNGNNLTISQPGAAQQLCPEPEGIMEQEAAFLSALPTVATFRIDGTMLEMSTAGGQIAIIASQVR